MKRYHISDLTFPVQKIDFPTIDSIDHHNILLFGAGSGGETALKKFETYKTITVLNIYDNDPKKVGNTCHKMVVTSPESITHHDKSTPIVISSMYFSEIAVQLAALGFEYLYDYHQLFPAHSPHFFSQEIINIHKDKIETLFNLLEDTPSQEALLALLQYRLTLDYKLLSKTVSRDQYFPSEIITLSENEVFVDAGAHVGLTALDFAKRANNQFNKIICFEPDGANIQQLKVNLSECPVSEKIDVLNLGVYDSAQELSFASEDNTCSSAHISNSGNIVIHTVSIDEQLQNEHITFIKMDIEGAEIPALMGAQKTIQQSKPKLAISVYHTPTDLWEIPLLLKQMNPEYKLYLRNHSGSILETVCYAIQ